MARQKGGLGRGLSSLLGGEPEAQLAQASRNVDTTGGESRVRDGAPIKDAAVQTAGNMAAGAQGTAESQQGQANQHDSDELPIELVVPNPDQPRTNFNEEELEELAESIKRNGLLQPILVRKVGEQYQIIARARQNIVNKLCDAFWIFSPANKLARTSRIFCARLP